MNMDYFMEPCKLKGSDETPYCKDCIDLRKVCGEYTPVTSMAPLGLTPEARDFLKKYLKAGEPE